MPRGNPFAIFETHLSYLDSQAGRVHRRRLGGDGTDLDLVATITGTIWTVGELRVLVQAGREWQTLKAREVKDEQTAL